MPDVVGQPEKDARAALERAGVKVSGERAEAPCVVAAQDPACGDDVDLEYAVELTVHAATAVRDVLGQQPRRRSA